MDVAKVKQLASKYSSLLAKLKAAMASAELLDADGDIDANLSNYAMILYVSARVDGESDEDASEYALISAMAKALAPGHGFNSERSQRAENGGRP